MRLGDQVAEITEGRPNTSVWRDARTRSWKRGESEYAVVSAFELTSTEQEFHLKESLRAKKGDTLIFDGGVPHRLRRTGGPVTRALRVATTPAPSA